MEEFVAPQCDRAFGRRHIVWIGLGQPRMRQRFTQRVDQYLAIARRPAHRPVDASAGLELDAGADARPIEHRRGKFSARRTGGGDNDQRVLPAEDCVIAEHRGEVGRMLLLNGRERVGAEDDKDSSMCLAMGRERHVACTAAAVLRAEPNRIRWRDAEIEPDRNDQRLPRVAKPLPQRPQRDARILIECGDDFLGEDPE